MEEENASALTTAALMLRLSSSAIVDKPTSARFVCRDSSTLPLNQQSRGIFGFGRCRGVIEETFPAR